MFQSLLSSMDLIDFFTFLIKASLGVGSIYLILQRFHLRLQMRFLKNISDEIIKINDNCIEFSYKYAYFIRDTDSKIAEKQLEINSAREEGNNDETSGIDYDEKLLSEVEILRAKTNNHLDYLTSQITSFPYGNPINFFWYSLTGNYLFQKVKIKTDELLVVYQDSIVQDSIIQTGINLKKLEENQNNSVRLLCQEEIDLIVVNGIDLIEYLEDHSKKLF